MAKHITWTRKKLTEVSGWFNQSPLTPLDKTLRFPLAIDEIKKWVKEKYGIALKSPLIIHNGFVYFRPYAKYILEALLEYGTYISLIKILRSRKTARKKFEKDINVFIQEFESRKVKNLSEFNNKELYSYIQNLIKWDANWIIRIGFGHHILHHFVSETLLSFFYKLLVKGGGKGKYQGLFAGYISKRGEADMAFWRVVKGKLSLDKYIDKFGLRATEASLIIFTIGENRHEIESQIKKLKDVNFSTKNLQEEFIKKRKQEELYVEENIRTWIPGAKNLFHRMLNYAKDYVCIRENRRFYYAKGSYLVRRAVLELGKRLDFLNSSEDIFFLTKNELENIISNYDKTDKENILSEIEEMKMMYNKQKEVEPLEKIRI